MVYISCRLAEYGAHEGAGGNFEHSSSTIAYNSLLQGSTVNTWNIYTNHITYDTLHSDYGSVPHVNVMYDNTCRDSEEAASYDMIWKFDSIPLSDAIVTIILLSICTALVMALLTAAKGVVLKHLLCTCKVFYLTNRTIILYLNCR